MSFTGNETLQAKEGGGVGRGSRVWLHLYYTWAWDRLFVTVLFFVLSRVPWLRFLFTFGHAQQRRECRPGCASVPCLVDTHWVGHITVQRAITSKTDS